MNAEFDCTIPTYGLGKTVSCYISNKPDGSCIAGSYTGIPTPSSISATLDVNASDCDALLTEVDCDGAANCDWCPNECLPAPNGPGRWSGYLGLGLGECANSGSCRTQAQFFCEKQTNRSLVIN